MPSRTTTTTTTDATLRGKKKHICRLDFSSHLALVVAHQPVIDFENGSADQRHLHLLEIAYKVGNMIKADRKTTQWEEGGGGGTSTS
ncbi:hypothetical protein DAPPUDRAFT_233155 [Daphnia pulex]|uniref:Uncharacterized protein n=1 Tax=Daphnia pulex TaxID=6669 RepID=E9FTD8_DAPPU|nr:hypothetical protein DAPPUDRAFT_233155 [Daphnia pulex]|eukprot:EFX89347.1 hypothetical protein DAPPUDRAFT_233155 [Daphnia pulex]